jgi:hypothetical protein
MEPPSETKMTERTSRTKADPGFILCYDCEGDGLCLVCNGSGQVVANASCWHCGGRKVCGVCRGGGQVPPRAFTPAKGPLISRSSPECRLYIQMHPHDCGETRFPHRSRLQKRGDDMVALYEGPCPKCGVARRFEFVLDPEVPPPAPAFGGPRPSKILDPGQFFHAADEAAKDAPDSLRGLLPPRAQFARARLAEAAAAMEEVMKFIPAGEDDVPGSAFTTQVGIDVYLASPLRFTRGRLGAIAGAYRDGLRGYDLELEAPTMLDVLARLETELPALLLDAASWNSLDINYHPPFVERLWISWGEYRVSLHRIQPCEPSEALFHPHPWPSAMRILEGTYEMAVGFGPGAAVPPIASRILASGDFRYEMTHPDSWHYVRPIGGPAMTIMVTGKPWRRKAPGSKDKLYPLEDLRKTELLGWFRARYPSHGQSSGDEAHPRTM